MVVSARPGTSTARLGEDSGTSALSLRLPLVLGWGTCRWAGFSWEALVALVALASGSPGLARCPARPRPLPAGGAPAVCWGRGEERCHPAMAHCLAL